MTLGASVAAARRLGRPANVVINYSTLILREIFALEEARERSQTVADRLGPSDFNMPWMNARADLIASELLLGELGIVERLWPSAWDDAQEVQAWEHWLVSGRLAVMRAQLELGAGSLDDAVTWSRRGLEMAASGGRPKYEAIALTTLGQALTKQGRAEDAVVELGRAGRARVAARALGDPRCVGGSAASGRHGSRTAADRGRGDHPGGRFIALARAGERLPRRAAGASPHRRLTGLWI